ncbi:MAG: type IX secretion system membrane protein PorP/SprF [Chitinophagia bacterium]|nr:type IX secretion system membrane protein PorP/SprF [Chitinophagia bacterium]
MKRIGAIAYLLIFLSGSTTVLSAQDLHFSQFMQTPLLVNPAHTGFIPDGDYRLGVNYRNQWASVSAFPYKTMSAFGDVQLLQNSEQTGWLGLGGLLLRDVAGTSALTSTKVYGSVAYHQMIGNGSLVGLGFNVGWANKSINTSGLTFPSQWNGQFFDIHQSNLAPVLASNNINYLDMQVGLNYAYFPNPSTFLNAGFSAMHLNRPHESFFDNVNGVDNRIAVRYNGFLNASFKLNDQVIVSPHMYFSVQAAASEWVGGVNAQYNLSGDGEYVLSGGLYYRYNESLIPTIGLGFKEMLLQFSYDATMSSLKNFTNRRGAFEFSLVKQGLADSYRGNRRESMCPSFRY